MDNHTEHNHTTRNLAAIAAEIDHGAELNVKSKQGFTPLDVAMGKSTVIQLPVPKPTTVALLRQHGALEAKDVK